MVPARSHKPNYVGSNPTSASKLISPFSSVVEQRPSITSQAVRRRFESFRGGKEFGNIAQLVERHPVKVMVVGSNPTVPAIRLGPLFNTCNQALDGTRTAKITILYHFSRKENMGSVFLKIPDLANGSLTAINENILGMLTDF